MNLAISTPDSVVPAKAGTQAPKPRWLPPDPRLRVMCRFDTGDFGPDPKA
jgi:hypothetical protein